MITYPHPLDYAIGLKYSILDEKLPLEYTTSPETFVVEELVDFTSLGLSKEKGEYIVLRVTKKGLDTFKAISIISRALSIPIENLYYYGLKDKNATTMSYVFVKSRIVDHSCLPVIKDNIRVEIHGFISMKPRSTHFIGNRFRLFIETQRDDVLLRLKSMVERIESTGLPSYYGYQRFGTRRYNTHLLGKLILKRREDLYSYYLLRSLYPLEEVDILVSRHIGNYERLSYENQYAKSRLPSSYRAVPSELIKLSIDAYASYLFNLLLNTLIERRGLFYLEQKIPMPGCLQGRELYREILNSEGLSESHVDKLPCFNRDGLFRPLNNTIYVDKGLIIYEFTLKPGMYASIVMRELFKDGLVLND